MRLPASGARWISRGSGLTTAYMRPGGEYRPVHVGAHCLEHPSSRFSVAEGHKLPPRVRRGIRHKRDKWSRFLSLRVPLRTLKSLLTIHAHHSPLGSVREVGDKRRVRFAPN